MAQQFPAQMFGGAQARGNGFGAAPLAPDVLAQQQRIQQQALLAQNLLNQEPLKGQMVSGHYVAPNPLQGLARALQTYAGYKGLQELPQEQLKLQQAQQQALARQFGLALGGQQGGGAQAGAMQAGQPAFPLLPGRSAQESYALASQLGVPEYLKLAVQQGAPTDTQRDLMASGLRAGTPEYQQALYSITNRPTNVAPGGTLFDPITRQPIFNAPQNGIRIRQGPNGPVAVPVPGFSKTQADIAGAQTGAQEKAKAEYDLVQVPDGKGGSVTMPRSQAVQDLGSPQASPPGSNAGVPGPEGLGTTPNPSAQAARSLLPKTEAQISSMVDTIDRALSSPGLKYSVGIGSLAPTIPGTSQADFRAIQDQLQGQAFLQAYESLRGGGQITEVEGKKAENAVARLNSSQSQGAFKEALNELKSILMSARERAYKQAGVPIPDSPTSGRTPDSGSDYSNLWGG